MEAHYPRLESHSGDGSCDGSVVGKGENIILQSCFVVRLCRACLVKGRKEPVGEWNSLHLRRLV